MPTTRLEDVIYGGRPYLVEPDTTSYVPMSDEHLDSLSSEDLLVLSRQVESKTSVLQSQNRPVELNRALADQERIRSRLVMNAGKEQRHSPMDEAARSRWEAPP